MGTFVLKKFFSLIGNPIKAYDNHLVLNLDPSKSGIDLKYNVRHVKEVLKYAPESNPSCALTNVIHQNSLLTTDDLDITQDGRDNFTIEVQLGLLGGKILKANEQPVAISCPDCQARAKLTASAANSEPPKFEAKKTFHL